MFGTGGEKWTSSADGQGRADAAGLGEEGLLPLAASTAIGYDDSNKQFGQGKGVFLITGTWAAADLKGPMGSSLGLMVPPPASGGRR